MAAPQLTDVVAPAAAPVAAEASADNERLPNLLQAEAIRTSSDSVLLVASPGTGKTRVIRARLAYLLSQGVPVSSILVVTFTQHAAQQLKLRVQASGASGAASVERVKLGTFHSICASMLREHAPLLSLSRSFVVLGESEQLSLLASLMDSVGVAPPPRAARGGGGGGGGGGGAAAPPSASSVLKTIQRWKESGLRPADVQRDAAEDGGGGGGGGGGGSGRKDDAATALARRLYPLYQRRLAERGVLDYSDLTLGALRLFEVAPHVLAAYRQRYR